MITQYTREFRTGNVEAAIDYFALICLNADLPGALGKSQASVCHEALREFILETRDFAKLLGDIRADGVRIKGAIERRLRLIKLVDQDEFLRTITVQAATVADDKGLIADAVLLYHLAEDYDHVIEIINRSLSDTVSLDLGQSVSDFQPLKPRVEQGPSASAEPGSSLSLTTVDDPMTLARNMISLYNSNALYYRKIRQINRDACGLLLRMLEAKGQVEIGNWAPALDVSSTYDLFDMLFDLTVQTGNKRPPNPPPPRQRLSTLHPQRSAIFRIFAKCDLTQHRAPNHLEHNLHRTRTRAALCRCLRERDSSSSCRGVVGDGQGFDVVCGYD